MIGIDDTFVFFMTAAACIAVVGLDLVVLLHLRRLRLPEVATVLWVIWVVSVPIVGAISFLLVRYEPAKATVLWGNTSGLRPGVTG